MKSDHLYSRDSKGLVRTWQFEVDGPRWRTHAGLMNGQKVVSGWTLCEAKNVGRSNETSPCEQAIAEASAEMAKKLDRDYRISMQALDEVPPQPMLAQDFAKQKSVAYPVFVQPKLDGIRALVSTAGAFSRQFQRHFACDHILKALEPFFAANPDVILDGELYNHALRDDFNQISSIVRKQNLKDEDRERAASLIQFHVYDAIMPGDFEARQAFLMQNFTTVPADAERPGHPVRFVETYWAPAPDQVESYFHTWLTQGYEGLMVRVPNAPYEVGKRSKALLKHKAFITAEFQLLRIEEGNGNWAGYAKRVVFALPDGREVGAGIKGNQAQATELLKLAIGPESQVTIRYFTPTPDGVPRFPVAIDFHPEGRRD